jgi:hypothetical protein
MGLFGGKLSKGNIKETLGNVVRKGGNLLGKISDFIPIPGASMIGKAVDKLTDGMGNGRAAGKSTQVGDPRGGGGTGASVTTNPDGSTGNNGAGATEEKFMDKYKRWWKENTTTMVIVHVSVVGAVAGLIWYFTKKKGRR